MHYKMFITIVALEQMDFILGTFTSPVRHVDLSPTQESVLSDTDSLLYGL